MNVSRSTNAFTLLELLLAVAVFAVVLGAINSVYYAALRLRNHAEQSLAQVMPLQHTFTVMKRDLANLVLPGGSLSGSLQTTPTTAMGQSATGAVASAGIVSGQASPNFFTSGGIIDQTSPFSEIQKVSYLLLTPTNNNQGMDLFRAVTRNLLASTPEEPVRQPLMSGVDTMAFLYYDGTQWRNSWDSTVADPKTGLTNTLPQAIKVQISLTADAQATRRGQVAPIEMVVPIVVQHRTNTLAAASTGGRQ